MPGSNTGKKLNIAMFGHKHIPSREGGVEIVVEQLATRMAKRGHKVTCYNRGGKFIREEDYDSRSSISSYVSDEEEEVEERKEDLDPTDTGRSRYKNVRIKKVWTINARGLAAASSSIFASLAAGFGKYDIVHVHAEGPCIMCGFLKACGKRVIVTIHGLDHKRAKWGRFASWYIMKGEQAAVRHADEIIVLSKGVQDYFMELYGRRTVLIPNGVEEVDPLSPDIISNRWRLNKNSYILYLGRIVPEKGIHYLIEAYKSLDTDIKLVIAGGSSDTDEYYNSLKGSVTDEYKDKIIFTGFVHGPTLEELYSNAYVYCLPSDLEGMPLSLLEAMSYGNACLTSDIPECADVIEDNGVTFKKSDVSDLAHKLSDLISDPSTVESLKAQSALYITKKYNWDDVVTRTLKLYIQK